MDKETLSQYGWIVVAILVLTIMIALATPFGTYISNAVKSTTQGIFDVHQKTAGIVGLNIENQNFDNTNNGEEVTPPVTPPAQPENINYDMLDGQNANIIKAIDTSFRSAADYNKFKSVEIDGTQIDNNNYKISEGSTIVTLFGSYIKTLKNGTHTITIVSTDGKATANFTVNISNPTEPELQTPNKQTEYVTITITNTNTFYDATEYYITAEKGMTWRELIADPELNRITNNANDKVAHLFERTSMKNTIGLTIIDTVKGCGPISGLTVDMDSTIDENLYYRVEIGEFRTDPVLAYSETPVDGTNAEPRYTIWGQLSINGTSIANQEVTLHIWGGTWTIHTNASGYFEFSGLPAGQYEITTEYNGITYKAIAKVGSGETFTFSPIS